MVYLLPGDRLKQFREKAGFKFVSSFSRALEDKYMAVSAKRLRKLESSETMPTPYEIDAICDALGVTSDCWLRGICDNRFDALAAKTKRMTDGQVDLLIQLSSAQIKVVKNLDV